MHTQDAIRSLYYTGSEVSIEKVIPYTLIAGLFLSNFPEALASSMHMYKYGWGKPRILLMWSSIMLMTSVGAGLGYGLANILSDEVLYGVQGFAAGAMLTTIASSMIPEAVHLGGANFTGISVLMGFAATNLFQLLAGNPSIFLQDAPMNAAWGRNANPFTVPLHHERMRKLHLLSNS